MKALIIANGVLEDLALWQEELHGAELIVAADGGAGHARRLGLRPHAVVGDVDSLDPETAHWLQENGVPIFRHPAAKDETDLELALLYAAEAGAEEILILGALGGRLDHALANVHLLALDQLAGRRVWLLGADLRAFLLRAGEEGHLSGQVGDTVSLLPLTAQARGIHTAGLRWALHGATLRMGAARGVSNEMTAPQASVRLEEGLLLVVHLPAVERSATLEER